MCAGAVAVSSGICSVRVLLDVRAHRIRGQVEPNAGSPLAPQTAIPQPEISDIRHKIRFPGPVAWNLSSFCTVISFFPAKTVEKRKGVGKNEISIAKTIDHLPRVSERDQPGRLRTLRIKMLVPGVERSGKIEPCLGFGSHQSPFLTALSLTPAETRNLHGIAHLPIVRSDRLPKRI
ncbi:MAG TPA: hypothetical protein VMR20_05260 [Verrucomicrobiae bacterium]|nr:hypothetical protein [Verrucomicrobiae bacterium]